MSDCTTSPSSIRVDLLHAHGSPTGYLYRRSGCRCAPCVRQHGSLSAIHRAAHPEKHRAYRATYRSTHRDEIRAYAATHDAAYNAAHQEERRAYDAAYYVDHHEERLAYDRAWRAAHREESRTQRRNRHAAELAAPGTHTGADVLAQYERQHGRCFWGRKVNPDCAVSLKSGYHVDHVIPLGRGGSNGPENLVLACPSCNCHKSCTHPMDFAGVMF